MNEQQLTKGLTKEACARLVSEIFRQAAYDWYQDEFREEVVTFLLSLWAEDLATTFLGCHPRYMCQQLARSKNPSKSFRAPYCTEGERAGTEHRRTQNHVGNQIYLKG